MLSFVRFFLFFIRSIKFNKSTRSLFETITLPFSLMLMCDILLLSLVLPLK